jgi:uncharacterized protein
VDAKRASRKTKRGTPVLARLASSPPPRENATFRVKSASLNGVHRHVTIASERGRETGIKFHKTALVGPGDRLHFDPVNSSRVFVSSAENAGDLIPVVPHFERRQQLRLGAVDYEIVIKELTTSTDLAEYDYLEGFHYKTSSAIVTEESDPEKGRTGVGGRKGVLLAYLRVGKRLVPAGYIELHMPLLMCKPRHVLFALGFHHPKRPVGWDEWDVSSMRKYVNLIVRIARVVTSPDLRGLGLARILIGTAKEYARERWHVGGRRPLFMEISAEMLKYMDFATSAGLHFIGNTEGNLNRIHSDLVQMQRGQKVSFGIMTLQKRYLTQLQILAQELGRPFTEVLDRLKEITENSSEETLRGTFNRLQPQEWYLFKKVLRFPIPYFMCGLDEFSEKFVSEHSTTAPARLETAKKSSSATRVSLKHIRVSSTYEVPDSAQARAVRDCFGLDGNIFKVTLVGPVSVEASGGNIILVTGPSGSGKSVLLRVLDPNHKDDLLKVSYEDASGKPYQVAWMNDIHSDRPLIEHFSELWGMESSISALNQAGLSEAFVYLRPYRLLSRGQQYRARLAALSLGSEPVWLMDEFCADLDPFTARIVANNLRKHVIRTGRIAIVAAANNAHYIDALRPTQVIYLRYNGRTEVLNYREYVDEFCVSPR